LSSEPASAVAPEPQALEPEAPAVGVPEVVTDTTPPWAFLTVVVTVPLGLVTDVVVSLLELPDPPPSPPPDLPAEAVDPVVGAEAAVAGGAAGAAAGLVDAPMLATALIPVIVIRP
jgi:hypothetical protein